MVSINDRSSTRPVGPSAIQAAQAAAEERQIALTRPELPQNRMTLDKYFQQTVCLRLKMFLVF